MAALLFQCFVSEPVIKSDAVLIAYARRVYASVPAAEYQRLLVRQGVGCIDPVGGRPSADVESPSPALFIFQTSLDLLHCY